MVEVRLLGPKGTFVYLKEVEYVDAWRLRYALPILWLGEKRYGVTGYGLVVKIEEYAFNYVKEDGSFFERSSSGAKTRYYLITLSRYIEGEPMEMRFPATVIVAGGVEPLVATVKRIVKIRRGFEDVVNDALPRGERLLVPDGVGSWTYAAVVSMVQLDYERDLERLTEPALVALPPNVFSVDTERKVLVPIIERPDC